MPTSRTLSAALLGAVLATGCAASSGENVATSDGALGADVAAAGIVAESADAEGVLVLCNDRNVGADALAKAGVASDVARAIVDYRTRPDGASRWFASLDQIDALPGTDATAFEALLAGAKALGEEEAAGFDPPALAKMSIPSNLGRPPTSNDVTVDAGFDGLTPAQAFAISRGRLTNVVDPSNESIVRQTFLATHKMFTIAVGNVFVPHSPDSAFLQARVANATSVMMLGTLSAEHPTVLVVAHGRQVDEYARGADGTYMEMVPNGVPVVMRAKLNLDPSSPGLRIYYPEWSAKQLAHATTIVEEP